MLDKVKVNSRMNNYMKEYQKTNVRYRESHKKSVQKYLKTTKGQASKLISSAKFRANKSRLEFSIDHQWCLDRLAKGICEQTGIPFDSSQKYTASIDRIDSTIGYTPENCQMVVWIYNTCKNRYTDSDVLEFAKRLVEHSSIRTRVATT
jgi:hypothetical protein